MTTTPQYPLRPATVLCSGCDETIGAGDELFRVFSGTELVYACADCAPGDLAYTEPALCCGCGRLIRYQRSEHRRDHVSCDERCRLAGLSSRRRLAAQQARRKVCEGCGIQFTARRRDALYHSSTCRKRAHRARTSRQRANPEHLTGTIEHGSPLGLV